jgi:hypothetical protein
MSMDLYFAGVPSKVTFPEILPSEGGEEGSVDKESAAMPGVKNGAAAAAETAGAGTCWLNALGTETKRLRAKSPKINGEMAR